METTETDSNGLQLTRIVALNVEFFAALLGGDSRLGHRVIFYPPEGRFYYKEVDGIFHVAAEGRLASLLAALLLRCAGEMPLTVDRRPLFVEFREEQRLIEVVRKSRSTLAVAEGFFGVDSVNRRAAGPESIDQTARSFVDSSVEIAEGTMRLTVGELFAAFLEYCRLNGVQIQQQGDRKLKRMVVETVNQHHGVRLRHDLMDSRGRCAKGWSGLMFRNQALNGYELARN
ncbi:MAG: hypothetical protein EBY17_23155 [Acidobacteriia bacterium]|nr:hypothetical protein [Terriglobia bacterium]